MYVYWLPFTIVRVPTQKEHGSVAEAHSSRRISVLLVVANWSACLYVSDE